MVDVRKTSKKKQETAEKTQTEKHLKSRGSPQEIQEKRVFKNIHLVSKHKPAIVDPESDTYASTAAQLTIPTWSHFQ